MLSIFNKQLIEFAEQHADSVIDYIANHKVYKSQLPNIETWVATVTKGGFNLKSILTASPDQLNVLKVKLHNVIIHDDVYLIKHIYNTHFSSSSAKTLKLNGENYSSYHLVKKIGIKVCPYCNRNYVFNVPSKEEGKRRLSELDHFIPKDKYPIISMSFFNLVPICHSCNHIKSNSTVEFINPYEKFASDDLLSFNLDIKKPDFISNQRSFKLRFKTNPNYKKMFYQLKLDRIYPIHKDIAHNIIVKKYIYSNDYLIDIYSHLKNRFGLNQDDFLNTLLSANIQEEKLHEKPFSKLTKDIWNDLEGRI